MYRYPVTIPRITVETLKALEAVSPAITQLVKIPITDTEVNATRVASDLVNSKLNSRECILRLENIVLDETQDAWKVEFTIFGD